MDQELLLSDTQCNKKISVIIPAYNAHKTIVRTLGSILSQTAVDDVEVVIVNDCGKSYDEIVHNFSSLLSIRQITLSENSGPGVARQTGIDFTTSPYITFIDADDTFAHPFVLETLISILDHNSTYAVVVGSMAEETKEKGFIRHRDNLIWMFGKVYRRSFLDKWNIRFNKTRSNEDNGFNSIVRICTSVEEQVYFLDEVVYYWHYNHESITRRNNRDYDYNENFLGFIENVIYSIEEGNKRRPDIEFPAIWAVRSMAFVYTFYLRTLKYAPQYSRQNFDSCVKFYNNIYKIFAEKLSSEQIDFCIMDVFEQEKYAMSDLTPIFNYIQFIQALAEDDYESLCTY